MAKSPERKYVSQSDVPAYTLDQALRVARAIIDNYASRPTRPVAVAQAMGITPGAGPFKMMCGSAIAYGLTEGGYNANEIAVTALAKRILKPTKEGDDIVARREAFLKPRVPGEFLTRYDGQKLPKASIGANVLAEMGVLQDRVEKTLQVIYEGAEKEGLLRDIKGEKYVDLNGSAPSADSNTDSPASDDDQESNASGVDAQDLEPANIVDNTVRRSFHSRRVYLSHGKNRALIGPIKELLSYGELEPVVSVEKESASIPVPEKVMNDMRGCGAAIIHVDDEQQVVDLDGKVQIVLNPNVLIEIGAAMALYGKRFIVLLKSGVKLPSNLQGIYYLEYTGDTLDVTATVRLLKAIKEMKALDTPPSA